ncbi:Cyclin T1 [Quillaja saponaria]|uniref:Cyclin T1 n=1 Tax=Quillaja saponaria TaxID=32244 RepID=A0AAD7Q7X3_QUISA|nr:Cyclin T1 [Quillaja saponaria]
MATVYQYLIAVCKGIEEKVPTVVLTPNPPGTEPREQLSFDGATQLELVAKTMIMIRRVLMRKSLRTVNLGNLSTICLKIAMKDMEYKLFEHQGLLIGFLYKVSYKLLNQIKPQPDDPETFMKKVETAEFDVLNILEFDLNILTPHKVLFEFFRTCNISAKTAGIAYDLLNDGLKRTIYLQFHARELACSALLLGFVLAQEPAPMPGNNYLWDHFNVNGPIVFVIAARLLSALPQAKSNQLVDKEGTDLGTSEARKTSNDGEKEMINQVQSAGDGSDDVEPMQQGS